jgi:hypothetical protein
MKHTLNKPLVTDANEHSSASELKLSFTKLAACNPHSQQTQLVLPLCSLGMTEVFKEQAVQNMMLAHCLSQAAVTLTL